MLFMCQLCQGILQGDRTVANEEMDDNVIDILYLTPICTLNSRNDAGSGSLLEPSVGPTNHPGTPARW